MRSGDSASRRPARPASVCRSRSSRRSSTAMMRSKPRSSRAVPRPDRAVRPRTSRPPRWSSSTSTSTASGLPSAAAAIASAGDLGSSSVSFASLARRPDPNPPSLSDTATGSLELEDLGQVQERRPEDDDEHRREDERDGREQHLDRRLHRLLLGEQLTLQAGVTSLDAQNATERDTELVGLDDRADEARHLLRRAPVGHLLQRLHPAFTDPHLAERKLELL